MKTLLHTEKPYGGNIRLIKLLLRRESEQEYPVLFKWALQLLYFDGAAWVKICRIDNYPHAGRAEPHIHEYGKSRVRFEDIGFDSAQEEILLIGAKILLDKFHQVMKR